MNPKRAILWVGLIAVAVYANSVGNGFAYDDTTIVAQNPIVQEGRPLDAFAAPYWPRFAPGSGLYRPVTVASFAVEWGVFGGNPAGFHAVNVLLHAGVSVLVLLLLLQWLPVVPAFLGATVFAVHPIHTEAVANVVGRGELLASAFALSALLLYVRGRDWVEGRRVLRLMGIGALYFFAVASKEIAVTLPALLVLFELLVPRASDGGGNHPEERPGPFRRLAGEAPVFLVLCASLGLYLVARMSVLGTLLGELPAPELRGLDGGGRVLTALSLWPHYLRLLLLPLDLSADYSPGVLFPATGWTPEVVAGAAVLLLFAIGVFAAWRRSPGVAIALAWFGITILPVSHLLFPTGVLLAERTLYLPSVAVALLVAATWHACRDRPWLRGRVAPLLAVVVVAALFVRTVERNPSWMSTFTMLETLVKEHPESSLALRTVGASNARIGDLVAADEAYEAAARMAPRNYSVLTEVGHHHGERERWEDGERLLSQAVAVAPDRAAAYRLLAGQLIRQARYRDAHRLALEGLRRAGSDRELWSLVSETYIAKGDFDAALRAREAAIAQDPGSAHDLGRLADIHDLRGDVEAATMARRAAERASYQSAEQRSLNAAGRLDRPAPDGAAQEGTP